MFFEKSHYLLTQLNIPSKFSQNSKCWHYDNRMNKNISLLYMFTLNQIVQTWAGIEKIKHFFFLTLPSLCRFHIRLTFGKYWWKFSLSRVYWSIINNIYELVKPPIFKDVTKRSEVAMLNSFFFTVWKYLKSNKN